MKRSGIGIEAVADWHTLQRAFFQAARGKRQRGDLSAFSTHLDEELLKLRDELLSGRYQPSKMSSFRIRDPKPRLIHAPAFRDRVLHHALMYHVGPVLDRSLVFDTYACRLGKGTLAAVQRCQQQIGRYGWYAKVDMRAYFATIDHQRLKKLLRQRLKNGALLCLIDTIIDAFEVRSGVGLSIGSLTSQHFANFYLSGFDRLLLEQCGVKAMVRYMDDVIWWCDTKAEVVATLQRADSFLREALALEIKPSFQVNRSAMGVTFCGYRVLPQTLRLTQRKRRRYAQRRDHWESRYRQGEIDALALQRGYASVLAMTAHSNSAAWRRQQLNRTPPPASV